MKILLIGLSTLASCAFLILGSVFLQAESIDQPNKQQAGQASVIFAGGCFWCMEPPFEKLDGVISAVSGYTGGTAQNAIYKKVAAGVTQHYEVVEVLYDPSKVSYSQLVEVFWRQIDPTDAGGSFVDRGDQYRSAIFYNNDAERLIAQQSQQSLENSQRFKKPIATKILPASKFYKAEEYHQDYYKKNPIRYKYYRSGSGRDKFIKANWKHDAPVSQSNDSSKPNKTLSKAERLKQLTPMQYKVTQEDGTERPFKNEYWDNKKAGIYVDIVSGEALFSSSDKFKSGTGWPSFTKTLVDENVIEKKDVSFFMTRTEVRSKQGDSHLGHLFDDGPSPTGLRYCINSASLDFVPLDQLQERGYGKYADLF